MQKLWWKIMSMRQEQDQTTSMKFAMRILWGILDEHRHKQLMDDLTKYHCDVIGVQETHLRGTGNIELGETKAKYKLYYTGPIDKSHHGVGIIVNSESKLFLKQ